MKEIILIAVITFLSTVILGVITIPVLKRIRAGQTVLKYVEEHKEKNGTPTMGGLFFIIPSVVAFIAFGGVKGRMAIMAMTIGLAYMAVGFIDDFIKVKLHRNEGLKAYQKILFQLSIAVFAGVFAFVNGITVFHLPFFRGTVDLGVITVPIVALIFIAITNSVNLTDGLDGLAASTSAVYLVFIIALTTLQTTFYKQMYLEIDEYNALNLLSSALIGGLLGFLVFNTSKAKVFMGDTGSLSIGGFIGAISIFTSNSFFIPIIGITFVMSSISVIVQVAHFKRTEKRVFLMAPLHHHFQHKGYSEAKIAFCYSAITAVFGALSLIAYL